MRSLLSGSDPESSPKALVLGSVVAVRLIGHALRELGIVPVPEQDLEPLSRLPEPFEPGAAQSLRALLKAFLEKVGEPPAGLAHWVHPGVGPWADSPLLPQICQELGLVPLAPSARALSLFSNRLSLFDLAESLGISHLALSQNPLHSAREVGALLERISRPFPLVLKSVSGATRFGVLVLYSADELDRQVPLWLQQLELHSGEPIFMLERYLEGARRITVPFVRTRLGGFRVFPLVDCSLQSGLRKWVEVSPAEGLDPSAESRLKEAAARIAESVGYVGVGCLDFLVEADRIHLIEGMARLNSGFCTWEAAAGTSAVAWQVHATLEGSEEPGFHPKPAWQSVVGVRLCAEDPLLQLPQPGAVHELSETRAWDFENAQAWFEAGELELPKVDSDGDGWVAFLCAGGRDRERALTLARGALGEIWAAGSLQLNQRYLSEILQHAWVRDGMVHAGFLAEEFVPEIRPDLEVLRFLAAAAAQLLPEGRERETGRWAVGDLWVKSEGLPSPAWLGEPKIFEIGALPGISGQVLLEDGRKQRLLIYPLQPGRWLGRLGDWTLPVRRPSSEGKSAAGSPLVALVTGKVHGLLYREQTRVEAHEPWVLLHSQGRLVPHALSSDARVLKWSVAVGDRVKAGQELARFESLKT